MKNVTFRYYFLEETNHILSAVAKEALAGLGGTGMSDTELYESLKRLDVFFESIENYRTEVQKRVVQVNADVLSYSRLCSVKATGKRSFKSIQYIHTSR